MSPRRSREQWSELVEAWRASGQSCAHFAEDHGLNENTFAWWRNELRAAKPTPLTLVPVTPPHRELAAGPLEVVLQDGVVVRVPAQADPAWVARVVRALGGR